MGSDTGTNPVFVSEFSVSMTQQRKSKGNGLCEHIITGFWYFQLPVNSCLCGHLFPVIILNNSFRNSFNSFSWVFSCFSQADLVFSHKSWIKTVKEKNNRPKMVPLMLEPMIPNLDLMPDLNAVLIVPGNVILINQPGIFFSAPVGNLSCGPSPPPHPLKKKFI